MFEELEKKVRKPGQESFSLYQKASRKLALPITALLIRTSITPNQITVFNILLLLLVGFLFLSPTFWNLILGIALTYLAMVLDRVDGQVARYKSMENPRGVYFDGIFSFVLFTVLFFFLGTGFYLETGDTYYVFMGSSIVILNCFISTNLLKRAFILGKGSLGKKTNSNTHTLIRGVAFFPSKYVKEILLLVVLFNFSFAFFAFYTFYFFVFGFAYSYILSKF